MARVHHLKCWPGPFGAIVRGEKRFEWRLNDRGYEVGDILVLRHFDPSPRYEDVEPRGYSADRWTAVRVTYVLAGGFGMPPGYVCMSVSPVETPPCASPVDGYGQRGWERAQ